MRSWLLTVVIFMVTRLGAAPVTMADKPENLTDSGNQFVRVCSFMENNDPAPSDYPHLMAGAMCTAYLVGLADGIVIERGYAEASGGWKASTPYCVADTYGVEQGQRVRILLKYIRNHPGKSTHTPPDFPARRDPVSQCGQWRSVLWNYRRS